MNAVARGLLRAEDAGLVCMAESGLAPGLVMVKSRSCCSFRLGLNSVLESDVDVEAPPTQDMLPSVVLRVKY